jgi:hypothetical protein
LQCIFGARSRKHNSMYRFDSIIQNIDQLSTTNSIQPALPLMILHSCFLDLDPWFLTCLFRLLSCNPGLIAPRWSTRESKLAHSLFAQPHGLRNPGSRSKDQDRLGRTENPPLQFPCLLPLQRKMARPARCCCVQQDPPQPIAPTLRRDSTAS